MTHLLYASDEMFSSTQLVRQSKKIFDKLSTNEIEKAIILRDGKPNFMLLDFNVYENIMKEFIELKTQKIKPKNKQEIKIIEESNKIEEPIEKTLVQETKANDIIKEDEKDDEELSTQEDIELQNALKKIDELELDPELMQEAKDELKRERSSGEIKEFWN